MPRLEPLHRRHNRRGFVCGKLELEMYLDKTAMQHVEKNISKTFVLVEDENPTVIIGYYTIAPCAIEAKVLPAEQIKNLPDHGLIGAKVARLAVAESHQGKGHGKFLLMSAMEKFIQIADNLGLVALFVDAKDNDIVCFYKKLGFEVCCDDPLHLFMPTKMIKKAFQVE